MSVVVGYAGGKQDSPTYQNIKDYTESVRVYYDPSKISYKELLILFFDRHDGAHLSPSYSCQYRSAIFVHNTIQMQSAKDVLGEIALETGQKVFTDIEIATNFYEAEEYHQKYYIKNKDQCAIC